jgi:hypothetical protein
MNGRTADRATYAYAVPSNLQWTRVRDVSACECLFSGRARRGGAIRGRCVRAGLGLDSGVLGVACAWVRDGVPRDVWLQYEGVGRWEVGLGCLLRLDA